VAFETRMWRKPARASARRSPRPRPGPPLPDLTVPIVSNVKEPTWRVAPAPPPSRGGSRPRARRWLPRIAGGERVDPEGRCGPWVSSGLTERITTVRSRSSASSPGVDSSSPMDGQSCASRRPQVVVLACSSSATSACRSASSRAASGVGRRTATGRLEPAQPPGSVASTPLAAGLLAERQALVAELEHAKHDYLRATRGTSFLTVHRWRSCPRRGSTRSTAIAPW